MKFRQFLLLAIIVPLILAGCGKKGDQSSDSTEMKPVAVDVAQAVIRPMEETISAQGTLTPPQGASAKVAAVNAGRLIEVLVREGDKVSAGQVIATVDSRTQQAEAQSAVSALRVSEIQAKQMSLEAQAAATEHANAVKLAQLQLDSAKTELRKVRNGARPQEIAQADQAVNLAQANLDRAQTELERVKFLNEKGVAAKRELDDAKTAEKVAASELESARQQASMVHAGARSEDVTTAELSVQSAQAALDQARQGETQVAAKQQEAQAAIESVQQKRADLQAAQTTAGYAVLRAPLSGRVIHRNLNPGDMADPSTPVVEIANSRSLDLLANIPEEDGTKIQTGMPVRVSAATAPNQAFTGGVLSIGQVDPQSGLLALRISVANPNSTLKAGAFATAEIIVHTFEHATAIPKQAVISRGGKMVAFVVGADNVAHQRDVTTGVEQDDVIQVLSGVTPGETVIRLGQYELTDGMTVQPPKR